MKNTFINYNGRLLPKETFSWPPYSSGLLETMLWEEGRIALWPYHAQRWRSSCKRLGYPSSELSDRNLFDFISESVKVNALNTAARIRLCIFPFQQSLHFTIETFPYQIQEQIFRIGWSSQKVNTTSIYSGLKTFPRTHYDLALEDAKKQQWDDGLLLNERGRVAESAIANIFYQQNNTLYTPPLSEGCVDGVYRRYILDHYPVIEKAISPEELLTADAVFLTNALRGKIKVAAIGAVQFPV